MPEAHETKTKRIHFVRHGNTDANVHNTVQPPTQELNEVGFLQAEKVAERVSGLTIDTMIVSDFKRAVQTAEVIAKRNNLTFETSPLFREALSPTSLHGSERNAEKYKKYLEEWNANLEDPLWHYDDEENFHDLLLRAGRAVNFLEKHEGSDILVVTHGNFLRFLFSHILFKDTLALFPRRELHKKIFPSNVGISIFNFTEGEWNLVVWNDHAHLAESS